MKCLLIINTQSGHKRSAPDEGALLSMLKAKYSEVKTLHIVGEGYCDLSEPIASADALCVCGGDGTLSSAINALNGREIPVYFAPGGTVNDAFRSAKYLGNATSGKVGLCPMSFDGRLFTYVAAAGTFTPIGWLPKPKTKQKLGRLAYLFYAVKEYKVQNMDAQIAINGEMQVGEYTLIMALRSKYVFALPVNKMYGSGDSSPKILLIKSPKGAFAFIKLFFLFFRSFCMGFRKPYKSKNIYFDSFEKVEIHLSKPTNFCIDGEKSTAVENVIVEPTCINIPLFMLDK